MSKRLTYKDGTAFRCTTEEEFVWIQRKLIAKGYEWLGGSTTLRTWEAMEIANYEELSLISIVIASPPKGVPFMVYDLTDVTKPELEQRLVGIKRVYDVKEYMNDK